MNLTNQQLAFARLQVEAAANTNSALKRRAHWQAAVFQLGLALDCYARELQEQAGVKGHLEPNPGFFARLSQAAQSVGKACPEAEELVRLEKDVQSWLSRIQYWRGSLTTVGMDGHRRSILAETSLTEMEKMQRGIIEVVDVCNSNADTTSFSEALLREAIEQFAALVERQRGDSAEY